MKKLLAGLLFLVSSIAGAAPSDISCTGPYTNGTTVVCTGANMANENRSNFVAPWIASSNQTYTMADTFGTSYASGVASYQTDRSVVNNSKSIKFTWSGASSLGSNVVGEWYVNSPNNTNRTTGDKWTRGYFQSSTVGGQWLSGTFKFISEYGSAVGGCFLNLNGSNHNPATAPPDIGIECTSVNFGAGAGNFVWSAIPGGVWQDNKWYLVEWKLPCAATGTTDLYINTSLVWSRTLNGGGCNSTSQFPAQFANGEGSNSSFNQTWWVDGFVQTTARFPATVLIEVSDTTDCSSGNTNKVYQFPVSLSDTSISFEFNKGALTGNYLCVTDNQGASAPAYSLSGAPGTVPMRLRFVEWLKELHQSYIDALDSFFGVEAPALT